MQRFQFPLVKVLDFRRQQLEVEEAKVEMLRAERRGLDAERSHLESETADTRKSLMVTGVAESQDLVAPDLYLHRLAEAMKNLSGRLADWQTRADTQQQATVVARRNVRLLEKLEERKRQEWQKAVDREQENLAADLYLGKWKR